MKTTGTERGQISIPAKLRKKMQLLPGNIVLWEQVSDRECRLVVEAPTVKKPDPVGALGFARRYGLEQRTTDEWMKELREREED